MGEMEREAEREWGQCRERKREGERARAKLATLCATICDAHIQCIPFFLQLFWSSGDVWDYFPDLFDARIVVYPQYSRQ